MWLACSCLFFILGSIPAVQVFPQLIFLGGGLLPVCAVPENWLSVHLLGAAGEFNWLQRIHKPNIQQMIKQTVFKASVSAAFADFHCSSCQSGFCVGRHHGERGRGRGPPLQEGQRDEFSDVQQAHSPRWPVNITASTQANYCFGLNRWSQRVMF